MSWRRSSSSQIGASSARSTSLLVLTPPTSLGRQAASGASPDPGTRLPNPLPPGRPPAVTGSRTQVVSDSTRLARYLGTASSTLNGRMEQITIPAAADVQASAPTVHVSLSRVGVTNVEKVI